MIRIPIPKPIFPSLPSQRSSRVAGADSRGGWLEVLDMVFDLEREEHDLLLPTPQRANDTSPGA